MARLFFQLLALQLILFGAVFGVFGKKKLQHATKYQLQQKVFTLGSSYTVKDDHDKPVYKVNFYLEFLKKFILNIRN